MTIRDAKAAPLANRIRSQLAGAGFLDFAGAARILDDLRNVTHEGYHTELNSGFQASNSLTRFFPAQYDPRMDWKERLKKAFDEKGWSKAKLARESGVAVDNVRKYVAGKVDQPRGDTLDRLADALGLDPLYLKEGIEEAVTAKLVSWVSASGFAAPDAPIDMEGAQTVIATGLNPAGHWIALEVEGDSMDRISPPGSIIFVDISDRVLVPNACYVIADEDGAATYKRFRPNPDRWEPVSTNPEHEPIFVINGAGPRVIGRVRKSLLSL